MTKASNGASLAPTAENGHAKVAISSTKMRSLVAMIPMVPILIYMLHAPMVSFPWIPRAMWVVSLLVNIGVFAKSGRFEADENVTHNVFTRFFEPPLWSFSVWGMIFTFEILTSLYVVAAGEPTIMILNTTPYYVAGHLYQTLWCVSFRSEFRDHLWLSAVLLTAATLSFCIGHGMLTADVMQLRHENLKGYANRLLVMRLPLALHAGWLLVASLLNAHTWLVMSKRSLDTLLASAFLSAGGAAALGAMLTCRSRDPVIALIVALALADLSKRTYQKAEKAKKEEAEGGGTEESDDWLFRRALGGLCIAQKVMAVTLLAVGGSVAVQLFLI